MEILKWKISSPVLLLVVLGGWAVIFPGYHGAGQQRVDGNDKLKMSQSSLFFLKFSCFSGVNVHWIAASY